MGRFDRDHPSLASTVVLPQWDASARNLWPARNAVGCLAAAYAGSTVLPAHPGANWGDPTDPVVQEQRRAVERSQAASAAHHIQAAKDEEDRINEAERQRFAQMQKR
jgi:hypothetical protein